MATYSKASEKYGKINYLDIIGTIQYKINVFYYQSLIIVGIEQLLLYGIHMAIDYISLLKCSSDQSSEYVLKSELHCLENNVK